MAFKTVPILAALTFIAISSGCRSESPKAPAEPAPAKPLAIESRSSAATNVAALIDKLSNVSPPAQGSRATALVQAAAKPAAESLRIERRPPSAGAKPLERANAEIAATRAAELLPPVKDEVKGVRIGWYVNHAIDGFREAIDANKPLVLVVAEETCVFCQDLLADALRCPGVNRWAGQAVFAYSNAVDDRGANAIAKSLAIDAYPTVTVLEPESRILLERGRINGYFDGTPLGNNLETILWKTLPRRLPDDFDENAIESKSSSEPKKPTGPAAGDYSKMFTNPPPAALGVVMSWEKLGLKHLPPVPRCP